MREAVHCIAQNACSLGESPVWHEGNRALYWLDIAMPSTLLEWNYRSGKTRSWALSELACALTLSQNSELIVLAQSGVNSFDVTHGRLQLLAPAPFDSRHARFNDCGCDRSGRLWTGTMLNNFVSAAAGDGSGNCDTGSICRFGNDLTCDVMATGFGCPNTFAWSPDDRTFYAADSSSSCIYAYRYDLASGAIADRRVFANPPQLGIPDGSAIDSEGCLWNARWGAGCVVRFAPDGSVLQVISVPASLVTSCAFGGDCLDTLFVTTARCDLSEEQLRQQPLAGGVFSFKPPVAGLIQSRFHASTHR